MPNDFNSQVKKKRVRGHAIHHQIIMQMCYVSFKFLLFLDEDAQVGSMLELNLLLFLT